MNFSIIIPAHNEQKLIIKTINNLLNDGHLVDCEMIVVCNGCTDSTYLNVTNFILHSEKEMEEKSILLKSLDLEKPSKTNAINIGIDTSRYETLVLLDADILISGSDMMRLVRTLKESDIDIVAPKVSYNYASSSLLVRLYYQFAEKSTYNQKHRISNVIALAKAARSKIGKLPEVIADDEYIRRQFLPSQYKIIPEISFEFICALTVKDLVNVLTRVERGNLQLKYRKIKAIPLEKTDEKSTNIVERIVFVVFKVIAKSRAYIQYKSGKISQWERDESNR